MSKEKSKLLSNIVPKVVLASAIAMSVPVQANPFGGLVESLTESLVEPKPANSAQPAAKAAPKPGAKGEESAQLQVTNEGGRKFATGYSQDFFPVKKLIRDGQAGEALTQHNEIFLKKDKDSILPHLEHGVVALDSGKSEVAVKAFADAEHILGQEFAGSQFGSMVEGGAKNILSMVTGAGELTNYPGEAFERILMLNYKSIAYMLQGERKAYNVARRSIDWQNIEHKRFQQSVKAAKEELAKQEKDAEKEGNSLTGFGFADTMNKYYGEKAAKKLPSAYVNPFGYYMAGMVQEFDSYEDRSLRDNARISYKKALELNPKSKAIKSAYAAMKKRPRKGRRLVHVVIADGFAPEKRTVQFDYNISGVALPVKIPVYELEKSPIHRFEIQTYKGTRLARVSKVADINSIALRHQYDSLPFQQLNMTVSVIRSYFENKALSKAGFFGKMIGDARQELSNPDMRSWISLPESFQAARLEVPKNLSTIRIKGYDRRGRVLVNKIVKLNKQSHNFVYARNIGKKMNVTTNQKKMWVAVR